MNPPRQSPAAELLRAGVPHRAGHVRDRRDHRHGAHRRRQVIGPDGQFLQFGLARSAAGAVEPVAGRGLAGGLSRRLALRDQRAGGRPEERWPSASPLKGIGPLGRRELHRRHRRRAAAGGRGRHFRMLQPQPLRGRRPRDLRRRGRALQLAAGRLAAAVPRRPVTTPSIRSEADRRWHAQAALRRRATSATCWARPTTRCTRTSTRMCAPPA